MTAHKSPAILKGTTIGPASASQTDSVRTKTSRWKRRLLITAVCLFSLSLFHAPILTTYALLLTVDSSHNESVSTVAIGQSLGGPTSITEAVALYGKQRVDRVLIVTEQPNRLHQLEVLQTFEATAQRILIENGVPESAIQILHRRPGLCEWLEKNPKSQVVVMVHRFALQKEAWAAEHEFGADCASRIQWQAIADDRFDASNWWQHRQGVLLVFDESISLAHILLGGTPETDSDCCLDWDADQYEEELCRTVGLQMGRKRH